MEGSYGPSKKCNFRKNRDFSAILPTKNALQFDAMGLKDAISVSTSPRNFTSVYKEGIFFTEIYFFATPSSMLSTVIE